MADAAYSVSESRPFSQIDWSSFEQRPSLRRGFPVCQEKDWFRNSRCCMDGYSIEHANDRIEEGGGSKSSQALFLAKYPCVNGVELDLLLAQAFQHQPSLDSMRAPQSGMRTFEGRLLPFNRMFEAFSQLLIRFKIHGFNGGG